MANEYDDPSDLVAAGYDLVARTYTEAAQESNETRERYTRLLVGRLPEGGDVLDLGCGSGVPTTRALAESFAVTGVEISSVQLGRAREAIPNARFVLADMSRLELEEASYDGVVALYSIIHVPRDRQRSLLESIYSWLRPGGVFVASLASKGSEAWVEDDFHGAPMYWSSFDAATNERMVRDVGFEIESADLITDVFDDEEETFLWIVAVRPESGQTSQP